MERLLRQKLPRGKFVSVSPERSERMRAVRGRGNKTTEARLRAAIVRAGLADWCIAPSNLTGRPDFFFPRSRLAVFVDGCFWHGCSRCGHLPRKNAEFWRIKIKRNKQRDHATSLALRADGVQVIRLWEHELASDLSACVGRIMLALGARRKKEKLP